MTSTNPTPTDQESSSEQERPVNFPITGAVPRVERQQSHYEFLWAVRPPVAMTNLIHARRMLMHGETADSFFPPSTTVVVTSTIPDDELRRFSFVDELRLVHQFEPDYYLPFDFPVYGDLDPSVRMERVKQVAVGTIDMDRALGETTYGEERELVDSMDLPEELVAKECDTSIIPLIKGTTPGERAVMERTTLDIEAPLMAKYGTQYMTVPGSGNYPALREDLEAISSETAGYPMFVVGLLSPSGKYSLEGLPDNIVAAAGGSRWRKVVKPKSHSPAEMREAYQELAVDVANALDTPVRYDLEAAAAAATDVEELGELDTSPGNAATLDGQSVAGAAGDPEHAWGGRKRPDDALSPVEARMKREQHNQDQREPADEQGEKSHSDAVPDAD